MGEATGWLVITYCIEGMPNTGHFRNGSFKDAAAFRSNIRVQFPPFVPVDMKGPNRAFAAGALRAT